MATVKGLAVIVLGSVLMVSCATERRVLSLAEATAIASDKAKKVILAGSYSFHSEGDALVERSGWFGKNDILLFPPGPFRILTTPEEIAAALPLSREKGRTRARLHEKSVLVTGVLFRGATPDGHIPDCVFLIVEKTEETDWTEKPATSVAPKPTN
jgi:hypothetical protein